MASESNFRPEFDGFRGLYSSASAQLSFPRSFSVIAELNGSGDSEPVCHFRNKVGCRRS